MKESILPIAICSAAVFLLIDSCGKFDWPKVGNARIVPNVSTSSPTTKGETITIDNLGTFRMMAVTGPYTDHSVSETVQQSGGVYFKSFVKKGAGGKWDIYDAADASAPSNKYWINDSRIAFWSWYPYDLSETLSVTEPTGYSDTLRFSYTLPASDPGEKQDATGQPDIVFAGSIESRTFEDGTSNITAASSNGDSHAKDEYFDIVFHHALSKIQFAVSATDGTFNKNLKIKDISLSGIYGKGDCEFTAPSSFDWKNRGLSPSSFLQNYDAVFTGCTGSSADAPEDWTYNGTNGLYICDNAFFLIPQQLSNATIAVTFELDGNSVTKTAGLGDTEWKADHYYTYKIKAHGESDSIMMNVILCDWSERENYIPID